MQRFLIELRRRVAEDQSIGQVVAWLHLDYVIEQHERVANAKLHTTGDTYRFRREAGRLRFFAKETRVGMNDSRFNANATVIYELGLAGYLYDEDHPLSEEGEELRSDGDVPATGAFASTRPSRPGPVPPSRPRRLVRAVSSPRLVPAASRPRRRAP